MSTSITVRQRKFADTWLETGNGRKAARAAYNASSDNVAGSIASENLTKPNVIEYIRGKAEMLTDNMFSLALKAKSEQVRYASTKDLLDRGGFRAVELTASLSVVEHHHSGGIVIAQLAEKVSSELANRKLKQAD